MPTPIYVYVPFLAALTLLGLCVGSFCNVLILRIPRGEEFVKTPSHCFSCGTPLSWYENIPLVSWLAQGGKCRACKAKLSRQYPIVEAVNGACWLLAVLTAGDMVSTVLLSLLSSILLVIAVIDWRTFTIPNGLNLAILVLGIVRVVTDPAGWLRYLIGMVSVGGLFLLLWFLTGGRGLGMGDVKLMAAAGLLIGWMNILLAMVVGSVAGAVIHSVRMRRGAGRKLAFGPYLAFGIWFAALFGSGVWNAYLSLF
jgi:leader peptidase (prepilin peptidase)/N-methyltransferase